MEHSEALWLCLPSGGWGCHCGDSRLGRLELSWGLTVLRSLFEGPGTEAPSWPGRASTSLTSIDGHGDCPLPRLCQDRRAISCPPLSGNPRGASGSSAPPRASRLGASETAAPLLGLCQQCGACQPLGLLSGREVRGGERGPAHSSVLLARSEGSGTAGPVGG